MKLLMLAPVLFLTAGCNHVVPVKQTWPEVPAEVAAPCANLKKLPEDTEKLSEVISNVAGNYSEYHKCQIKQQSWAEWYKLQKEIFEKINK